MFLFNFILVINFQLILSLNGNNFKIEINGPIDETISDLLTSQQGWLYFSDGLSKNFVPASLCTNRWYKKPFIPLQLCANGVWKLSSGFCDEEFVILVGEGDCFNISKKISAIQYIGKDPMDPWISFWFISTSTLDHIQRIGANYFSEPIVQNEDFIIGSINPDSEVVSDHFELKFYEKESREVMDDERNAILQFTFVKFQEPQGKFMLKKKSYINKKYFKNDRYSIERIGLDVKVTYGVFYKNKVNKMIKNNKCLSGNGLKIDDFFDLRAKRNLEKIKETCYKNRKTRQDKPKFKIIPQIKKESGKLGTEIKHEDLHDDGQLIEIYDKSSKDITKVDATKSEKDFDKLLNSKLFREVANKSVIDSNSKPDIHKDKIVKKERNKTEITRNGNGVFEYGIIETREKIAKKNTIEFQDFAIENDRITTTTTTKKPEIRTETKTKIQTKISETEQDGKSKEPTEYDDDSDEDEESEIIEIFKASDKKIQKVGEKNEDMKPSITGGVLDKVDQTIKKYSNKTKNEEKSDGLDIKQDTDTNKKDKKLEFDKSKDNDCKDCKPDTKGNKDIKKFKDKSDKYKDKPTNLMENKPKVDQDETKSTFDETFVSGGSKDPKKFKLQNEMVNKISKSEKKDVKNKKPANGKLESSKKGEIEKNIDEIANYGKNKPNTEEPANPNTDSSVTSISASKSQSKKDGKKLKNSKNETDREIDQNKPKNKKTDLSESSTSSGNSKTKSKDLKNKKQESVNENDSKIDKYNIEESKISAKKHKNRHKPSKISLVQTKQQQQQDNVNENKQGNQVKDKDSVPMDFDSYYNGKGDENLKVDDKDDGKSEPVDSEEENENSSDKKENSGKNSVTNQGSEGSENSGKNSLTNQGSEGSENSGKNSLTNQGSEDSENSVKNSVTETDQGSENAGSGKNPESQGKVAENSESSDNSGTSTSSSNNETPPNSSENNSENSQNSGQSSDSNSNKPGISENLGKLSNQLENLGKDSSTSDTSGSGSSDSEPDDSNEDILEPKITSDSSSSTSTSGKRDKFGNLIDGDSSSQNSDTKNKILTNSNTKVGNEDGNSKIGGNLGNNVGLGTNSGNTGSTSGSSNSGNSFDSGKNKFSSSSDSGSGMLSDANSKPTKTTIKPKIYQHIEDEFSKKRRRKRSPEVNDEEITELDNEIEDDTPCITYYNSVLMSSKIKKQNKIIIDQYQSYSKKAEEREILKYKEFGLIQKSTEIFSKICPEEEVPSAVVKLVYRMFRLILSESFASFKYNGEELDIAEIGKFYEALDQCYEEAGVFVYKYKDPMKKTELLNIELGQIQIPFKMPLGLQFENSTYDLTLEIIWKTIIFTQYYCSPYFKSQLTYRMKFYKTIEQIFNPDVVYRWHDPEKSLEISNSLLKTFGKYNMTRVFTSLDQCVGAAHSICSYKNWIRRPKFQICEKNSESLPKFKSGNYNQFKDTAGNNFCFKHPNEILQSDSKSQEKFSKCNIVLENPIGS